jgi:hypothetical protein
MLRLYTWKKLQPANILLSCSVLAGFLFLGAGCASSRGSGNYEAPRLGAEYRFEDGMKREKKPQYLFSNKERKEMEKMGLPAGAQNEAVGAASMPASTSQLPTMKTDSIPPRDSVYKVLPPK